MRSDGVVDEIKSRLDIVEVVGDYLELRRAGANYKARCPFHNEKTPSFMVNPDKQIYHCFGCGAGGDLFSFVMKYEGIDFREALSLLAKRAGVELKPLNPQQHKARQGREAVRDMQGVALKYFTESLTKTPEARNYLLQRGITEDSIAHFSLGFAPGGWHNLYDRLKKMGYKDETILQSGLIARGQRGPYDVFRERVIFPIFDRHGEPIAFGGRVMGQGEPKYLNSSDSPIFKKSETLYALDRAREAVRAKDYAMVVEGYLDVIMCHQYGLSNAVAPLGTALTGGQLRMLKRLSQKVLLVFDGDQAGINAARRSLGLALEQEMRAKVLSLPEGEDPDSILASQGVEGMKALIAKAQRPMEFMLASGARDRVASIKEAVALIEKVGDPIMRDELIRELAEYSGTREQTLREALQRQRPRDNRPWGPQRPPARPPRLGTEGPYDAEVMLLSTMLHNPGTVSNIMGRVETGDFLNPVVREIIVRLTQAEDLETVKPLELAQSDEERALITQLSVKPGFDPEFHAAVAGDCIRTLNARKLESQIRSAQSAGDLKLLNHLYIEKQKLLQGAK